MPKSQLGSLLQLIWPKSQRYIHKHNSVQGAPAALHIAHLDVFLLIGLETREDNLALARLEAVEHVGDGPQEVRPAEQDELAVHKVAVADFFSLVVQECTWYEIFEPCFALLHLLLRKGKLQTLPIFFACSANLPTIVIPKNMSTNTNSCVYALPCIHSFIARGHR